MSHGIPEKPGLTLGRLLLIRTTNRTGASPLRRAIAAFQSTPLLDRNIGKPVGMLSTLSGATPLSASELLLSDPYARQAADVITFRLGDQRLRESAARLQAAVNLVNWLLFVKPVRLNAHRSALSILVVKAIRARVRALKPRERGSDHLWGHMPVFVRDAATCARRFRKGRFKIIAGDMSVSSYASSRGNPLCLCLGLRP